MSLAAVVCLLILYRDQLINGKALLALAGAALLVFACLLIYGYHSVATRLEDFSSIDQLDKFIRRRRSGKPTWPPRPIFPRQAPGLEAMPRSIPCTWRRMTHFRISSTSMPTTDTWR